MNKKQKTKIEKLLKMLPIAIMLTIIVTIGMSLMSLNAYALDVDINAAVADPDCYWSDGPGSELYVASGKTCTIDSTISAKNFSGWTDYAVIVYSGGTLEIVIDTPDTTNVDFTADGDIYNMGTINVGNGGSYDSSATLQTNSLFGNGDITIVGSDAAFYVTANAGTGKNNLNVIGDITVGSASNTAAKFELNDSGETNSAADFTCFTDSCYINNGKITVDNLRIKTPNSGSSNMIIADGAEVALNDIATTFGVCIIDGVGKECSVEIGANTSVTGTGAILTVNGDFTVPLYAAHNVSVKIGGGAGTGTLSVGILGAVYINETGDFATPGDPTTEPNNSLYIASDSPAGIITAGYINSNMFVWNQGDIDISSATTSGRLYANNHYKQNSGLNVASGDSITITGEAYIDGDSTIDGILTVTQCAVVLNGVGETFTAGATANIDINTDVDLSCALLSGADVGLWVKGPNTTFSITDGATHAFDVWRQFTVDDGAYVDMSGEFTVNGLLKVQGDVSELYIDDSTADASIVSDITVGSSIASPPTPPVLTINGDGALYLTNGDITVAGDTSTSLIDVYGTLSVNPAATGSAVSILDYGRLSIASSGVVNADGDSGGGSSFIVWGGELDVYGTLNFNGTADMEMWVINDTQTADVHVYSTGLVDSHSTPASNIGLNYDSGTLTIDNGGQMLFDDEIDIDTADLMNIDGYLEGTDEIDFNGITATHMVGPSGEMKVVGLTDYKLIDIHQNLGVLGKLNGDDGNGDIYIDGTAEVGGPGASGKDSYTYLLARDLLINTGASIDVSNYENCYDPGGSPTYGGSYGGEGAGGNTTTFGGTKYTTAPIYDTKQNPVGMHGFDNGVGNTTNCGGAVYIEVHRDIQIDGDIKANAPGTSSDNQGAGSGGLIIINHAITHSDTNADFTGSANIEAVGGSATGTTNSFGGGGGRIVIDSILFEEPDDDETGEPHYQYTGGVYTYGGQTNNGTTDYAASGTIAYLGDDNSPNGTLISDAGNRTPQAGKETLIPVFGPGGNIVFDRMHARDGADILYAVDPLTDPIGCYVSGTGSSINLTGGSCVQNADKPDTMHINTSFNGAGTLAGLEPWTDDGVSTTVTLNDYDPVFSVVMRNPELTAYEFTQVEFQVNSDSGFGAGTMMWESGDTNNPYVLTNTVHDGERTEDIEYAGDPLAASTTYYVRARLSHDFSGPGLWTHMGMGNEYKFTTTAAYYDISNTCSSVITILDGINPVKNSNGQRYGTGSCTFIIDTSTNALWKVLYGMSPNGTIFSNTNGSNVLTAIDNPGGDAIIDTTGNTNQEEYGFNIITGAGLSSGGAPAGNVEEDPTILQLYDNWADVSGDSSYVFDIADNGSEDKILEDNGLGVATAGYFDLNIHLNVADNTVADDYSLETWMILTQGP